MDKITFDDENSALILSASFANEAASHGAITFSGVSLSYRLRPMSYYQLPLRATGYRTYELPLWATVFVIVNSSVVTAS